ncbi:MAG: dihydropteroate synthase [Gammaproteobacteria bacterium]|nr:dihydropteroate synthase [Gammaproteobacteria bacterium]
MLEFDFPAVMGILNVTPDSFSDGGRYLDKDRAMAHALELVEEGAAIIDIGGESTRPGAEPVPVSDGARTHHSGDRGNSGAEYDFLCRSIPATRKS